MNGSIRLAVLVDPGEPSKLAGLLEDYPVPMLPVGTKPLVQHWLERLRDAGVEEVLILVEHLPEKTRHFVEEERVKGINYRFAAIRQGQSFKAQMIHVPPLDSSPVFIADFSVFPMAELSTWLNQDHVSGAVISVLGGQRWAKKYAEQNGQIVECAPEGMVTCLHTPLDLWQINMDVLSGQIKDPEPFGFEVEPGSWVASNCKIDKSVRSMTPVIIGADTILSKGAVLGPNVIVGEKCVIDKDTLVQDCLILGRTFIGPSISVRNMILAGEMVYRLEDDVLMHVNDMQVMSRTGTKVGRVELGEQVLAGLTLLLTIVPMLLIGAVQKINRQNAFVPTMLYLDGGRDHQGRRELKPVEVLSLNVSHVFWRKAPWFWWVIKKDLALAGSSPRHDQAFEYPFWVSDAEEFVPGVCSLADLNGVSPENEEEVVIADAYQIAKSDIGLRMGIWGKWLLNLLKI